MQPVNIPQHIDDPIYIMIWRIDELLPLAFLFVVGILFEQMFICIVLGFIFSTIYKRVTKNLPDGYALHYLYWIGIYPVETKNIRNPFIRNFLP